jgi:hypothetical protein
MERFFLITKESGNLFTVFENVNKFFKSANFLNKQKLCQKNITLALY